MTEINTNRLRNFLFKTLAVVVLISLAASAIYWFLEGQYYESTDNAYVSGDITPVSAQISGKVTKIYVRNTDYVEAGTLLLELDDSDTRVALEKAKAQLAQTLRATRALFAQTEQLKANWQQAEKDYQRVERLRHDKNVSEQDLQHAYTALNTSKAAYDAALAQTQNTSISEHPQVLLAIAALKQAWLDQQRTKIRAPVSGHIAQSTVELGDMANVGKALLAVVALNHLWIDANFKETQLSHLRIGQSVEITSDTYGSQFSYHGKIKGISAGTGSVFSLLPPQNATGNWIKIVQRIPVRITLDSQELEQYPLRIGSSVAVRVDTHQREGKNLLQVPAQNAAYSTDIYQHDKQALHKLIEQIIQAN